MNISVCIMSRDTLDIVIEDFYECLYNKYIWLCNSIFISSNKQQRHEELKKQQLCSHYHHFIIILQYYYSVWLSMDLNFKRLLRYLSVILR